MTDVREILGGNSSPAEDGANSLSGETTQPNVDGGGGVDASLSDGAGAVEQNPGLPVVSSTVPSGYTIEYCSEPRWYKIDSVEVPSVTTVLDVLHKSALPYWGNKIGAEGVLELVRRGLLVWQE